MISRNQEVHPPDPLDYWQLGPGGIAQVVVEERRVLLHLLQPLGELVHDVLPDVVRPFELLPTERAEPLVLSHLLAVRPDELLNFVTFSFQTKLASFSVSELDRGFEDSC